MRQVAHVHLAIAALLAVVILASVAAPAAARPNRFQATEHFAFKLVNCLRTGGKVMASGHCRGYGSGNHSKYRKPLRFSDRISNQVSWPWASRIARANYCWHEMAGSSIDRRFRTVGLRAAKNGENLACHSAISPRRMVIYWVRRWYKETSYGGAHWHQIKDPDFRSAGFGVAKAAGGRTRLVINFYGRVIG